MVGATMSNDSDIDARLDAGQEVCRQLLCDVFGEVFDGFDKIPHDLGISDELRAVLIKLLAMGIFMFTEKWPVSEINFDKICMAIQRHNS
jgi:hypothetical protein